MPSENIVIIGGGWAGLSAAVHLAGQGPAVTLVESADQLGGRARSVMFGNIPLDNGQHIALGAYRHMLALLDKIGVEEERVFLRWPLRLDVRSPREQVSLEAPRLPAPLHLLAAFMRAHGLNASEKWRTLVNWQKLIRPVDEAMTVAELLRQTNQAERVNRFLWEPLCIAALNTLPQDASARLFQRVLRDAFNRRRSDSDLLIPRYDLGRILPAPAQQYLQQQGVTLRLGQRATALETENGRINGVRLNDEIVPATQVIIATNPWSAAALIQPLPALADLHGQIDALQYEPITTVYLRYARPIVIKPAMQGTADMTSQWFFDRRLTGQPKVLAAIISAGGEHMQMDRDALAALVAKEAKLLNPSLGDPEDSLVIREKRATFSAAPATEKIRPGNATALSGCWLAGDYTATGYPATLEGAIISGKNCARELLESL